MVTRCVNTQINGKGKETPVADAPTCIEIIWELPGKVAREFRRVSANKIARLLAGDLTLVDEIERRYVNTNPIAKQFLLQNTDQGPPLDTSANTRTLKRKAELDIEILEREHKMNMDERKQKMIMDERKLIIAEGNLKIAERNSIMDYKERNIRYIQGLADSMENDGNMDDRDHLLIQDRKRSMLTNNESIPEENQEISIPFICQELGIRPKGREGKIGKKLVKLWRKKYNHPSDVQPPKRASLFDGRKILINAYYNIDRDIVEEAIRYVCDKQ
jgi:hypothetical protein